MINICFHGIGTPGRPLEPGEDRYWIGPALFEAVLDLFGGRPDIRFSFDDGNSSDLEIGLPALLRRGLTADFFVLAARLDEAGSLGEKDVRQLHGDGMRIGSHGMHHRPWRGMSAPTARVELVEARERIAAAAGAPVETAACPLGRYDRGLVRRMRRLGYTRVFTSDRRPARVGAWLQPRYSVRVDDTPESLRAEVSQGLLHRAKLEAVGLAKRLR